MIRMVGLRITTKERLMGFIFLSILVSQFPSYSQEEGSFKIWLNALKEEAENRGYSRESINLVFSEIKGPVERILANDRNQAEVVQTYADYLDSRVNNWKRTNGIELMKKHRDLLQEIGREYGVQPRFIVSIWGMETGFGTVPIKESVFSTLATLAYDKRRADFYRAQFFAALTILDSGFPPYERMKSSWAGAMGQSQFLPESYLRYAVDYNGDGKRDIWDTEADVFASIANYLSSFGWNDDETWGRRVLLPTKDEKAFLSELQTDLIPDRRCEKFPSIGIWKDLQEWQALGVRRMDGTDLPNRPIPAALLPADPGDGEGFIIYGNFCTIMRFNPAFKYALSIGLLSDLIESD
ncbi:MAG: lytic murein transglycosylase [Deltaproteobacteria bacterium]|nr:lytic murein transglycosylase [Deltaproteobacteria bacterium]